PAGPRSPLRRRRPAHRVDRGNHRPRRPDAADAGALRLPAPRAGRPPDYWVFHRDRRRPANGRRAARGGRVGARFPVPAFAGVGAMPLAGMVFALAAAFAASYAWYLQRARRLSADRLLQHAAALPENDGVDQVLLRTARSFPGRHRYLPPLAGLI